jgi:hypothetical protein
MEKIMEYMKYFAYGMNTNIGQMATRCPQAVDLGAALLPNYEFRFAGVGDILENTEFDCQGVLWDITPDCLKALDRLEGYPWMYDRKLVTVLHNGENVQALVYYMLGNPPDDYPSEHYHQMLVQGYQEHGIDVGQIDNAIDYIYYLEKSGKLYHQDDQPQDDEYAQNDYVDRGAYDYPPSYYDDVEDVEPREIPQPQKPKGK